MSISLSPKPLVLNRSFHCRFHSYISLLNPLFFLYYSYTRRNNQIDKCMYTYMCNPKAQSSNLELSSQREAVIIVPSILVRPAKDMVLFPGNRYPSPGNIQEGLNPKP